MVKKLLHQSDNDRQKAFRLSKIANTNNRVYCTVCNEYIRSLGDSDLSLLRHKSRSSKHKSLLLGNSIVDDSGADMEVADVDPSNDGGEHCPRFPVNSSTNAWHSTY